MWFIQAGRKENSSLSAKFLPDAHPARGRYNTDAHPAGSTGMPLTDLHIPAVAPALPRDIREFLREADSRIEHFQKETRAPAFVPSDYHGAYHVLRTLEDLSLTRGNRFCEWGSGFGVVADLAAWLGFESYGIEVDADLVAEARRLAVDFVLTTEFVQGSFVPRGGESKVHATGTYSWMTTEADYAYDDLGLDPDDFDVVFAYPWPDEEEVTAGLFHRFAGPGAVLVTYTGEGFRARRKVAGKKGRK
jgi:hypothetical protein